MKNVLLMFFSFFILLTLNAQAIPNCESAGQACDTGFGSQGCYVQNTNEALGNLPCICAANLVSENGECKEKPTGVLSGKPRKFKTVTILEEVEE
jgi:hypothetical protein